MKQILYLLTLIIILYGIYYFFLGSGRTAQEQIRLTQVRCDFYSRQLDELKKITQMKGWQAHLVSFQRLGQLPESTEIQKLMRDISIKHHVKIIEWKKHSAVNEISLVADLDTDVYEFWQACARQFQGQVKSVLLGLFRPHKPQEKVQGRIHFVNIRESGCSPAPQALDSIMFTKDELRLIKSRRQADQFSQYIKEGCLICHGILYMNNDNWTVWLNRKRVSSLLRHPDIEIHKVSAEMVSLTWRYQGKEHPILLRPQQGYDGEARKLIDSLGRNSD